uniref:Rhodanese domain-containing protein n=1 Tax=Cyanidium caldarium TaxID=2771 RepID=Q9TM02_CYACA|nr:photochlorophyllide reductase subunit ChlN [Cyanidium caldarium]AAF12979.1 unknown [Cyanidium caldarium]WDB00240.1 photochlorophyllide reductase subunit ChlN [Cyanidium caldarium]
MIHFFDILTDFDYRMYNRQMILPELGLNGQINIKKSRVLCVGAGALGASSLMYLCAAGFGRLGIVDFDRVAISNLQRQIIHTYEAINTYKTFSAFNVLKQLNIHIKIDLYTTRLSSLNAVKLISYYDLVIDASDNFETKCIINDTCQLLKKPMIYAAVLKFIGQISVFNYRGGPSYRTICSKLPDSREFASCSESGVIGALPGVLGSLQAIEAVKVIIGKGQVLSGGILTLDVFKMFIRIFGIVFYKHLMSNNISTTLKSQEDKQRAAHNQELKIFRNILSLSLKDIDLILKMSRYRFKFLLLDVRTQQEHINIRFLKSSILPYACLENVNKIQCIIPKFACRYDLIILYCQCKTRSLRAARALASYNTNLIIIRLHGGVSSAIDHINQMVVSTK